MDWIRHTSGLMRFGLLGVLILIVGWFLKPGTGEAPPARPKAALTIEWVAPVVSELPITLAANGSVSAWQEAVSLGRVGRAVRDCVCSSVVGGGGVGRVEDEL